jgi:hypothetical protein
MTAQDDPRVRAVAEALRPYLSGYRPDEVLALAGVATDAQRRAVLDGRPDAERWTGLRDAVATAPVVAPGGMTVIRAWTREAAALLDALADETARADEAVRVGTKWKDAYEGMRKHRDLLGETVDELGAILAEQLAALPEWRCPSCGAVTRARMADQQGKD